MAEDLFDEDFLQRLEVLNVIARKILSGQLRAHRQSVRRGTGVEFADYRPYAEGDDFRRVDWNIYRRLGEFVLKLYREEEQLTITVLLDASRSMAYGVSNKFDYSRRVGAAISYIGLCNLDRVHIVPFTNSLNGGLLGLRGKGKIFDVFEYLGKLDAGGQTDLASVLRAYTQKVRKRGLAIVISDFLDLDGFAEGLKALRYYRNEVFVIHILDTKEEDPPLRGDLRLTDMESGASRDLTITDGLRAKYRRALRDHIERVRQFCMKNEIGYCLGRTSIPFDDLVMTMLRQGGLIQ
ncbi:MAG: DUF58 domain-containing protein [Planctomycetota bacterium]|nr:DUF58 domain-containing protein [Planctomycetota bacterium]